MRGHTDRREAGAALGAQRWLAVLFGLLLGWFGVCSPAQALAKANAATAVVFDRIESARAMAMAPALPPSSGWVSVELPDVWQTRWPDHNGVVWYRLIWTQARTDTAPALLIEGLADTSEVWLNGSLLTPTIALPDPSLYVRRLPRYWHLGGLQLRQGVNTLLVRVSGLALADAGLSAVQLGDAASLQAAYEHLQARETYRVIGLTISLTVSGIFLLLWLMRRRDAVYGWFSLMTLAWSCQFALQHVIRTPWPFESVNDWQRITLFMFVAQNVLFMMFILRFCHLHWRRLEAVLALWMGISAVLIGLLPMAQRLGLALLFVGYAFMSLFASSFILFWRTWRTWPERHADLRFLSLVLSLSTTAGILDLLHQDSSWLGSEIHYTFVTTVIEMISMPLILAGRFASTLRRIENFNTELGAKVAQAREELALTLQRQYALEVANARLSERHLLAHDLHDGLGSLLVSRIAALEHGPGQGMPADQFLSILKDLRDELRTVVDLTASQELGDQPLAALIAPLRQRISHLCEARGIDCRWDTEAILQRPMSFAQGLDVLRVLQEAISNILKHSQASEISVAFRVEDDTLRMRIADNGVGFDTEAAARQRTGIGLGSMSQRARRLGGRLVLTSRPGETVLSLSLPWDSPEPDESAPVSLSAQVH